MSLSEDPERAGIELASAMAQEAILECTDPIHGEMVAMVKFHDPERSDMLMDDYLKVLFFLGNYSLHETWNRSDNTYFEEAFYDVLNEQGALRDLTIGPY